MDIVQLFSLLVVAGTIALLARGLDVRLLLMGAALLIGTAAGDLPLVLREFLATFSNEKFVVPICSAMGFAWVLKHTECERHLVLLLVHPLRRVRALLVPGVVLAGFLVNIPLISQTSTAVCLGAVVVPLMRAAGYSMPTIGATLLLGASVGGELLNPGAPELLTVFRETGIPTTELARNYMPGPVFLQLAVSAAVLWALSVFVWERAGGHGQGPLLQQEASAQAGPAGDEPADSDAPPARIDFLKAMVPLVPLVLLFATAPPLSLFDVPDAWVIAQLPDGSRDPAYNSRLIGLAMLVGVLCAAAAAPRKARDCAREFFGGAGYGFTHIVSLIVVANCFGKAIQSAGFATLLGELIAGTPALIQPLAVFVPLAFAAISGSGMASTQSLYAFFHAPADALGLDPAAIGALVSLGSAAGRTLSPVAAVVLMCATLTGTSPFRLAARVAVPLLIGVVVVLVSKS